MEQKQLVALVKAAQKGDEEAFAQLYREAYNNVYYTACKILQDKTLAEDITQEVFIAAYKGLEGLKKPAAFFGWLGRITAFQCASRLRKKSEVPFAALADDDEVPQFADVTAEVPGQLLEQQQLAKLVAHFIDELPEAQRAAVVLYYYQRLSVKDIAEAMDTGEGTIKSRLNYARKALKKSVEQEERKSGVPLHALAPLVFGALQNDAAGSALAPAAAQHILEAVIGPAAIAISAAAAGGGAAVATAGAAGIGGKVAAGVAGLAVVMGLGVGLANWLDQPVAHSHATSPAPAPVAVSYSTQPAAAKPAFEWTVEPTFDYEDMVPLCNSDDNAKAPPYLAVKKDGKWAIASADTGERLTDYFVLSEEMDYPTVCFLDGFHEIGLGDFTTWTEAANWLDKQFQAQGIPFYANHGGHGSKDMSEYIYAIHPSTGKLSLYCGGMGGFYKTSIDELSRHGVTLPAGIGYIQGDFPDLTVHDTEEYRAFLENKRGICTNTGEILTGQIFDKVLPQVINDVVIGVINDKYVYYSLENRKIIIDNSYDVLWESQMWQDFRAYYANGFCPVAKDGKYGFMNKKGELAVPLQFEGTSHVHAGQAWVKQNGRWGRIKILGEQ